MADNQTPAAGTRDYVGRPRELTEIDGVLDDVSAGRGRLLLLNGEPGIGKTRLLEETSARATNRGMRTIIWGRCWPGAGAPTFWPWVQILRGIVDLIGTESTTTRLGPRTAYLAALLPELASEDLAEVDLTSDAARFQLFDTVATFLHDIARDRPVLLLIDDLHWADHASLVLLEFIAQRLPESQAVICGTYRTVEIEQDPVLREAIQSTARHAHTIALRGLNPDEIRQIIEQGFGKTPPDPVLQDLVRTTEGNPFFVDEIVRSLTVDGRLTEESRRMPAPESVLHVIRRRLAPLSPDTMKLLRVGAVHGNAFGLRVVARAADIPMRQVAAGIHEARALDVVSTDPDVPDRATFRHALIRDAVYEDIEPEQRRQIHGDIARAMEEDPRAEVTELAHHFSEAGDFEKAFAHTKVAARRAVRQLAFEDAARLLKRALALLRLTHPSNTTENVDLLLSLGEAQERANDLDAEHTFLEAAEAAHHLRDADRQAQALAGMGADLFFRTYGVPDQQRIALLTGVLRDLDEGDSVPRAVLTAQLAVELVWSSPRDVRVQMALDGSAMARRLGDPWARGQTLILLCQVLMSSSDLEMQFAAVEELISLATTEGSDRFLDRGHVWRLQALLRAGRHGEAEHELSRLAEDLEHRGEPRLRFVDAAIRAALSIYKGRHEEGARQAAEAMQLGASTSTQIASQIVAINMLLIAWDQGRMHDLVDAVEEQVRTFPDVGGWTGALTFAYAEAGRVSQAKRTFRALEQEGFRTIAEDQSFTSAVTLLAVAADRLGESAGATTLYDLLHDFDGSVATTGGIGLVGPVSYALGLLAATMGRHKDAERHLRDAIDMSERTGGRPSLARSQLALGRLLLEGNRPEDRPEAESLLENARDIATELGMAGVLAELDGLPRPVSASRPGEHPTEQTAWREPRPIVEFVRRPDGVRIAHASFGSGTPLVWMPPLPVSHLDREWSSPVVSDIVRALASRFRLVRFDPRGVGMSSRDAEDFSLASRIGDLEAVVDRLDLDRFVLVGADTTTSVAVAYAAAHPDRLSALVLLNPYLRQSDVSGQPQTRALARTLAEDWEIFTETIGGLAFGFDRVEARMYGDFYRACVEYDTYRKMFRAIAEETVEDVVHQVRTPTLVVRHHDLKLVTDEMTGEVVDAIPDVRLFHVEGRWADDIEVWVEAIVSFVGGEPQQPTPALWRDRYEPVAVLGEGGQGKVLRARDHQHDRMVALKVRPAGPQTDRTTLLAEARVLLNLKPHPGVTLVRDDFFHENQYVIVMEWIEGTDLGRLLADRGDPGLPLESVLTYLQPVAAALDHLHGHDPPIIHADVKPANIILTPASTVVLVDFGISSSGGSDAPAGSPGYRAPEVAAGNRAGAAADIYGLAATAHTLLTGRPPDGSRPAWEGMDPAVIGPVERTLRRCLATDPERRPGSAGEFLQRLRTARAAVLPSGVITFLLTDIEGSSGLWDAHPRGMEAALERHDHLVAEAVENNDGVLIRSKGEGDSTFSVFTRASDAVASAMQLQHAINDESWPEGIDLRVRAAIHTGEAQARGGDYFGGAINRAARLRSLAGGGQVLLSQTTAQVVADTLAEDIRLVELGSRQLRGLRREETVYELREGDVGAPPAEPATETAAADEDLATLIGREQEISTLRSHLAHADVRLVTVTGPGGVGKTSLTLEGIRGLDAEFPDGTAFVELAAVSDSASIPSVIAHALGIRDVEGKPADVVAFLSGRRMLLVLDNFEHLVDGTDFVSDLLRRCPGIKILVTSRVALRVNGERELALDPLALPTDGDPASGAAFALFVRAAQRAVPEFSVTDHAGAVAEICRRLDGLPLALELAAARLRLLSPDEILERLDDRFALLSADRRDRPDHQRGLRATLDWSYGLLEPDEQLVFRCLGAFSGGFTVKAVEAVCPHGASVLDGLDGLLTASLVRRSADPHRFELLETVRAYAKEHLESASEQEETGERHLAWFLALAEDAAPELTSGRREAAMQRIDADLPNIRAALRWALDHDDAQSALRLGSSLGWYWYHRGLFSEGLQRLQDALAFDAPSTDRHRAEAATAASRLARYLGDAETAQQLARHALEQARRTEDRSTIAWALHAEALAAMLPAQFQAAAAALEEAVELIGTDDQWASGFMHLYFGMTRLFLGDTDGGESALDKARGIFDAHGDEWSLGATLFYLGVAAQARQDLAEARNLVEESLPRFRRSGDRWRLATALTHLAGLAEQQGEDAGPLREEGAELFADLGVISEPPVAEPPAAARVPLPRSLATRHAFAFVGREPELGELRQAFTAAPEGGRCLLVTGEPGIGKTRLVSEFADAVHAEGALVLAGRCDEGLAVPYQPFVEALRWFIDHAPDDELRDALGRWPGELVRIVPELAERLPDLPDPVTADPETERWHLLEAVCSWLAAASAKRPVLLVLEDVHWAAGATVQLLRHLVRTDQPIHALVIATYRDAEIDADHPLSAAIGELRRAAATTIQLVGLDDSGVDAFVRAAAGHDLDEAGHDLSVALREATQGVPLFLGEILRHLVETRTIYQRDGRWVSNVSSVDDLQIPDGARDILRTRLARLSPEVVSVLTLAAVFGPQAPIDALTELSDLDRAALVDALEEAIGSGLITEAAEDGRPVYAFSHALVRRALYDDLSLARRQQLHLAAAQALERTSGDRIDRHLSALAEHYRASGDEGTEKAIEYSIRAGEQAARVFAYEDAVAHLEAAAELMERQGADPIARAELLGQLGDLLFSTGVDPQRGVQVREEVVDLHEATGDAEQAAKARSRLGNALATVGGAPAMDVERALQHLRAAETVLGDGRVTAAAGYMYVGLANALMRAQRSSEGLTHSTRALEIADALGHTKLRGHALVLHGWATWMAGRPDEARDYMEEAYTIGTATGDPFIRYLASWTRGNAAMFAIEPADAAHWYSTDLDSPWMREASGIRSIAATNHVDSLIVAGRVAEARTIDPGPDWPAGWRSALTDFGEPPDRFRDLHDFRGSPDGWGGLEEAWGNWGHLIAVEAQRSVGAREEAETILRQSIDHSVAGGVLAIEARARAELAIELADTGRPEEAIDHARRAAQILAGGDWRGLHGLAQLASGLAAGPDDASLPEAVETFRRFGARWHEARALHLWGRAHLRAGNRQAAAERIQEAVEILRSVGYSQRWIALAERDLEAARGVAPMIPTFGRESVRDRIVEKIQGARQGAGPALLVRGPAGIGKTHLLEAAVQRLERDGWLVLRGTAVPEHRVVAYGALRSALRSVPSLDPESALGALVSGEPGPPAVSPEAHREILALELTELLEREAASRPVVLMLDDMHWSDATLIALLRRLVAGSAPRPWALLLASRTDEPGAADVPLARVVERLELEPLPEDALEAAVRHNLGEDADRLGSRIDEIVVASTGNPLFALELARQAIQDPSGGLPVTVVDLLGSRLDACSAEARSAVEVVALLGEDASFEIVLRVCADPELLVGREAAGRAVEELLSAKIIVEGDGGIRLSHPLYRNAALDSMSTLHRARVHALIAGVFEQLSAEDPGAWDEPAARHRLAAFEAGRLREHARAAAVAGFRTARRAKALFAEDAILELARGAIDAYRALPAGERDELRADAFATLVLSGSVLGGQGEEAEAEETLHTALELPETDAERAAAWDALANVCYRRGDFPGAVVRYRQGLAALREDSPLIRAEINVGIAWSLFRNGRAEDAMGELEAVIPVLEEHGVWPRLAISLDYLAMALVGLGREEESLAASDRAFAALERCGEEKPEGVLRLHRGMILQRLGRFEEALVFHRAGAEFYARVRDPYYASVVHWAMAENLDGLGRLEEALAERDAEIDLLERVDNPRHLAAAHVHRASLLDRLGNQEAAEDTRRRALDAARSVGSEEFVVAIQERLTAPYRLFLDPPSAT